MRISFSSLQNLFGIDLVRFIKFGVVGGSGIFVNMGFLWFFTEIVGLYYLISSVLAIALAMISNFIWNDLWTWQDRGQPGVKPYLTRLVKFILVSSFAGYVGNLSLLWILTHFFHLHYLISNLFGIAVGTVLNYSINNFWTFKPVAENDQNTSEK